jgi:hypothetical protein
MTEPLTGGFPAVPAPPPDDGDPPRTPDALEERLSRPTAGVRATLERVPGDVVVLGAGGKMGPSLARMVRRALDELGGAHARRRVTAVSRWADPAAGAAARAQLAEWGVETAAADLLDRRAIARLPDAPVVIYMTGLKFGTSDAPARMWATNTVAPALAAERYAGARVVAFSTGNVYPLTPAPGRGAAEDTRSRRSASTRTRAWRASACSSGRARGTAARSPSCGSATRWTCATACSSTWRSGCAAASRSTCAPGGCR